VLRSFLKVVERGAQKRVNVESEEEAGPWSESSDEERSWL
jgi:hypothetical protein